MDKNLRSVKRQAAGYGLAYALGRACNKRFFAG
jgi:hypothetical protein